MRRCVITSEKLRQLFNSTKTFNPYIGISGTWKAEMYEDVNHQPCMLIMNDCYGIISVANVYTTNAIKVNVAHEVINDSVMPLLGNEFYVDLYTKDTRLVKSMVMSGLWRHQKIDDVECVHSDHLIVKLP